MSHNSSYQQTINDIEQANRIADPFTYRTIHSYMKQYPDHARLYEYKQALKARMAGFEPVIRKKPSGVPFSDPTSFIDALRRSKTQISDIVLSNPFDMFATFTFNGKEENLKKFDLRTVTNREDPDECKRKMSKWLKNQRELRGRFSYLIVPEYHKDGKSLHFHALLYGYKGIIEETGKTHGDKPLYRIKSYKIGLSNLKKIGGSPDDIQKVASYIKKYITKEMPIFAGKKRYWVSQDLIRPTVTVNPEIDPFTRQQFADSYQFKNLTIKKAPGIVPLVN